MVWLQRDKRGFLLIEIMITGSIIAVLMMASSIFIRYGFQTFQRLVTVGQSIEYAQNQLESFQVLGFTDKSAVLVEPYPIQGIWKVSVPITKAHRFELLVPK